MESGLREFISTTSLIFAEETRLHPQKSKPLSHRFRRLHRFADPPEL